MIPDSDWNQADEDRDRLMEYIDLPESEWPERMVSDLARMKEREAKEKMEREIF